MTLADDLRSLLAQRPGSTARELQQQLASLGRPKPAKGEINSTLYAGRETFRSEGDPPPRWYLIDSAGTTAESKGAPPPAQRPGRKPAAVRRGDDTGTAVAPAPPPERPIQERPLIDAMSKGELITTICAEIGVRDTGIGPGSTEPKAVLTEVIRELDLPIDSSASKPELAEAIARAARLQWHPSMDSRGSPSGGGDTVTADGLRQVLRAVWALQDASRSGAWEDGDGETPTGTSPTGEEPDAAFGLVPVPNPPGGGTGLGGGGEGPIHKALKAYVKESPLEAIGEHLTYLAEDLTDPAHQVLGDEIGFVTGDRVDLLMRDGEGRLVVIEVEPDIGPSGHIGFHQAAKYWVLVAVANGLELDQVRRLVVARTIDAALGDHYREKYGIEPFEVSLP